MDAYSRLNVDTSLRGPLLAAHRNLRKAVAARSADCKGQSTRVAWSSTDSQTSLASQHEIFRALKLSQSLQEALSKFGGPSQIPQEKGFADYVLGRGQCVQAMVEAAKQAHELAKTPPQAEYASSIPDRQQQLQHVGAQVHVEACEEFRSLFCEAFWPVLSKLPGAEK